MALPEKWDPTKKDVFFYLVALDLYLQAIIATENGENLDSTTLVRQLRGFVSSDSFQKGCLGDNLESWLKPPFDDLHDALEVTAKDDKSHAILIDQLKEIHKEIKIRIKAKAFDRTRSVLNHTRIKNEFLNFVASGGPNDSVAKRSTYIVQAWMSMKNPAISLSDQAVAQIDSVSKALAAWPSISEAIKEFFDVKPGVFSLELTEKGKQLRRDFFEGDQSYIGRIDKLICIFDETAKKTESEQEEVLANFWQAADGVHKSLSAMALKNGDGSLFGGYFELKDE